MTVCRLALHEAVLTKLLHVLADLGVDFKVLGNASVQAETFTLVNLTLGVGSVDALLVATIDQSVCFLLHVSKISPNWRPRKLESSTYLLNISVTMSSSASAAAIF